MLLNTGHLINRRLTGPLEGLLWPQTVQGLFHSNCPMLYLDQTRFVFGPLHYRLDSWSRLLAPNLGCSQLKPFSLYFPSFLWDPTMSLGLRNTSTKLACSMEKVNISPVRSLHGFSSTRVREVSKKRDLVSMFYFVASTLIVVIYLSFFKNAHLDSHPCPLSPQSPHRFEPDESLLDFLLCSTSQRLVF